MKSYKIFSCTKKPAFVRRPLTTDAVTIAAAGVRRWFSRQWTLFIDRANPGPSTVATAATAIVAADIEVVDLFARWLTFCHYWPTRRLMITLTLAAVATRKKNTWATLKQQQHFLAYDQTSLSLERSLIRLIIVNFRSGALM